MHVVALLIETPGSGATVRMFSSFYKAAARAVQMIEEDAQIAGMYSIRGKREYEAAQTDRERLGIYNRYSSKFQPQFTFVEQEVL